MLIRYGNEPQLSQFSLLCNTEQGGLLSNVSSACARHLPEIDEFKAHDTVAVICGGGPSIEDSLVSIRALKAAGAKVFALNNAAKYLATRGIKPDYHVVIDPRQVNVDFFEEAWAEEALLCSHVHPEVFDQCEKIGYKVRLWHPNVEGITDYIPQKNPLLVSVSLTVGISTLCLAHALGHRNLQLFGYDCSHKKERSHAYGQPRNASDEIVRCVVDSQVFYASMAMAGQAAQFKEIYDMLARLDCKVEVHGEGLLPAMYRKWQQQAAEKILTAVYDLGVSPPSYDFLSFLIEAERHRRANGYTAIDIMFQPGPMHGFRDDELPPDIPTREGMLWRVCVGMAKLLPTVRNVEVKRVRWQVSGDVFPEGYKENNPVSHYATKYLKGGEPLLKASEFARAKVKGKGRYATITLRQSSYWQDRNSNVAEWEKVALWLWNQGIEPIFIPDTDGKAPEGWNSCIEAAYDIDMRAAMYEGAFVNLGVLNGPMSLVPYLKARYLICKVVVESAVASTTEFLSAHGFNDGDDFGGTGKMIWKEDRAENIIPELKQLLSEETSWA